MWRIHKITIENSDYIKTVEGEFGLFYDKKELKTYSDIKNKFKNFKLDEEYEQELKDEGCQSITYLRFFLYNGKKEDIYLFLVKLELSSMTDLKYEFIRLFTVEDELEDIYDVCENYLIKIKYETKFYKFQGLENEDENEEDENEEDEKIPPEIEDSFPSNNCIICYTSKPNILNFPCLHISTCKDCEEMGRFIKCSICRKEIQRKVKITI